MNNRPFLTSLILLAMLGPLPAADAPKPPFVKAAPAGTTWSVEIRNRALDKPTDAPAEDPGAPKLVVSVPVKISCHSGTNGVQVYNTAFSDGKYDEYYVFKRQMLRKYDGSEKIAVLSAPEAFPGLEWLPSGGTYVGEDAVDSKPCYKFKVTPEYLAAIPLLPETRYFAWIEIATGYPVQVQTDDILYRYSAVEPWNESVELPPAYQAALKKIAQQQRALEVMRAQNAR